jgi:multiple antibiotic resistance protein
MHDFFNVLLLTFMPLFIAIDPLSKPPFVLAFTEELSTHQRNKIIHAATGTAALVGLAFLFFGQFVLKIMGISVGAFAISGGAILFILSINYITKGRMVETDKQAMTAIVPIGTPLITGPATITTLLVLQNEFPLNTVLLSFAINLLITWGILLSGNRLIKILGRGGFKAISQVFNLLLAAIAITMILRGLDMLGIINLIA